MQVLQPSGAGDAFNNIRAQLEDGHWVLAFESETAAQQANSMVEQHAAKLRAFYCAVCTHALFLLSGKLNLSLKSIFINYSTKFMQSIHLAPQVQCGTKVIPEI